jgi:hypothetical protein
MLENETAEMPAPARGWEARVEVEPRRRKGERRPELPVAETRP